MIIGHPSGPTDRALAHAAPARVTVRSARGTDPALIRAAPVHALTARPHLARRARHARRSLARSRTHASCRGRAPSACPSPLPRFVSPPSSTPVTYAPLYGFELRAGVELRADESKQQIDATMKVHVAIVCIKCFRGILQVFVYQCCKNRSGCYTCCNGYTRMFQVYVSNISSVIDVCYKSLIRMLQK